MPETATLTILGRPVTFTTRQEACMPPRVSIPVPGPCPERVRKGPISKKRYTPTKVAVKPKPAPQATPKPEAKAVPEITRAPKKTYVGNPRVLSEALQAFQDLAQRRSGWTWKVGDDGGMHANISRPGGEGEITLESDGYQAQVRRRDGSVHRRVHPGPFQAVMDVMRTLNPDDRDLPGGPLWFSEAFEVFQQLHQTNVGWNVDLGRLRATIRRPDGGEAELTLERDDGYTAVVRRADGSQFRQSHPGPAEAIEDIARELRANR